MAQPGDASVKSLASTIADIWRLSAPYFRSEDRWMGRVLLAGVIAIELSLVGLEVLLNQWYNRFYNTLQDRDWGAFVSAILFFCVLAAVYTVLQVYQLYVNQWLQIRWRRWMTQTYLRDWITSANHYRMQLLGDAADNPDQRIAEDLRLFVEYTLTIGPGILNAIVSFCSFVVILWTLSVHMPLTIFGANFDIPGYLVWAALLYAVIGTVLTQIIGRLLVPLNFQQQRLEADFRFNLVRTRENAEQIAALKGETAEREEHLARFGSVVGNWYALMQRQKRLLFFTQSYSQAAVIFPYIVVAPAYFSGAMQLGGLMQTASAFNSVQKALSYFISAYRQVAEWRAIVERLTGFEAAMAAGRAAAVTPPVVQISAEKAGKPFAIDDLKVRLPDGRPLVAAEHLDFSTNESVLITGPSGAGKSTLLRAISGIWPFGSGQVSVPEGAKVMLVPQRPYFPLATLADAIAYPATHGMFDNASIAEVLAAVGLPQLISRLDEQAHWNRMLSQGEQQRLAIARALLQKPDYVFLDEATAALDERAEASLYRLLLERHGDATIVSIGHRATLNAFHRRRLEVVPGAGFAQVREVPLASAAE
jgi:putative ATP-binding cassette transporter